MTDKHVLQASGQPRGQTQHKKKKWAEKFSSRLGLPSRRHCVVYCIWKCRLSTYCIYYQPPPALKPAVKTKLWTISEKKKQEKKTQLFNQSSNVFKEFKVSFRVYCKYNRNSIFRSLVKYKLCGCSVFWSFSCLFVFKCRYVGLCSEHLTSHCTSWCWILCFFCVLKEGSIGPKMELKRFCHLLEKQNQSQGTPSDKHLVKARVIYWLDWRAVHPLSIKSMRQISHAERLTSLTVCMHSACICNQIFMNDFFFDVCSFFSFVF